MVPPEVQCDYPSPLQGEKSKMQRDDINFQKSHCHQGAESGLECRCVIINSVPQSVRPFSGRRIKKQTNKKTQLMYDSRMLDLKGTGFPNQIIRARTGQWTLTLLELSDLWWRYPAGRLTAPTVFPSRMYSFPPRHRESFFSSLFFLLLLLIFTQTFRQRQGGEK